MANHANKQSRAYSYFIITVAIIVLLGLGLYFVLTQDTISTSGGIFSKSIKNETITAENYKEIMDKIEGKLEQDEDYYYLSYACFYYVMQDGFANILTLENNEGVMYQRIYGKTVKQLINEGKQLMKDNNVTIESYKENLKNFNGSINEYNNSIAE